MRPEGNFEGLSVYKSVGEMGRQVSQGAAYTNEYLAGLDTQMDAVEAMNALASLVQVPGKQTIQEVYDLFLQGLDIPGIYRLLTDVTNRYGRRCGKWWKVSSRMAIFSITEHGNVIF